ncbi:FG-GAP repeat protein [Phycisphaerae bacterium RAS2]|nr:FG-GAP repeat protein [Phycisphaerae bacterium RAS2]
MRCIHRAAGSGTLSRRTVAGYMILVLAGTASCLGTSCFSLPGSGSGFPKTTAWTPRTVNTGAATRPSAIGVFDFDNDSRLDVVVGYQGAAAAEAAVFIFFQDDVESFTAVRIGSGADLAVIRALAISDLDGDGHRDVVAACNGRLIYLHSGADARSEAGWSQSVIAQSDDAAFGQWNDVAIGNIDGAAGSDIVACNETPGRVSWFRSPAANIADGTGWTRIDIAATGRTTAAGVALDDFNFDGRVDVISTAPGEASARAAWFANPADPVAGTWTKHTIGNLPAITRVITADLNVDGRSDVVVINPTGRIVGWYQRPTDATTNWSGFQVTMYTSNTPTDLQAANVDNNAQPDILVSTQIAGTLRWFVPTPGQAQSVGWVENNLRDLTVNAVRIAVGDFDGDGRPDVVAAQQGAAAAQDSIVWYENPEE